MIKGSDMSEPNEPDTEDTAESFKTRSATEYELVQSDRMKLIASANVLVENTIFRQIGPIVNGSYTEGELSDIETKTYDAALEFLRRQFEAGFIVTESYVKKVETENTIER